MSLSLHHKQPSIDMSMSDLSFEAGHVSGHRSSSAQSKSLYQLARPARHAHHPFHRMRPRLLMQLQQISQMGRPIPLLDVFPSTTFMPFLTRGLALYFRRWRGLSPEDVIIVQNTLCESRTSILDKKHSITQHEDRKNHDMVANICQPLHKSVLPQTRTKIYLSLSSPCEAFCLANGSYEFLQQGKNGIQTMRWALRHRTSRHMSNSPHLGDASRLFTFSIIDPGTRRHAVLATMTRDWMEVSAFYCSVDISKPCSDVDAELREFILVTGIWVALREEWT